MLLSAVTMRDEQLLLRWHSKVFSGFWDDMDYARRTGSCYEQQSTIARWAETCPKYTCLQPIHLSVPKKLHMIQ